LVQLPDLSDVRAARDRIRPHVHRTPLLSSRSLGEIHGARLHLKAENLQRGGAFKIRGALNAVLGARERGEIGPAGVLTYSSGNHGQAVALAARIIGAPGTVVVPEDIAPVKLAAIREYGARVVPCGLTSEERHRGAMDLAAQTGAFVVPPYEHPDVIAGQGTTALEIIEDLPEIEALLVPVGGGGLIAGIAIAAKALKPGIRIIGVEPDTANDMALSLAAGRKVSIPPSRTIADGLRALTPGDLTFEAAKRCVDEVWCVDDASIAAAQEQLLERTKLFAEPSGAAAAAAFIVHGERLRSRVVAVVLSGGNADVPPLARGPR
jgi:threonine dehydratase